MVFVNNDRSAASNLAEAKNTVQEGLDELKVG